MNVLLHEIECDVEQSLVSNSSVAPWPLGTVNLGVMELPEDVVVSDSSK